jgi:hypothetical protein
MQPQVPTLEYESRGGENSPRVSRLALGLIVGIIPGIFLGLLLLATLLPVLSRGRFDFRSRPSYFWGPVLPLLLYSSGLFTLSIFAMRRIRDSSGRLIGLRWARAGIKFWSSITVVVFAIHLFVQYTDRESAIYNNVCVGGRIFSRIGSYRSEYPDRASPDGCDYLVSGLKLPPGSPPPSPLIIFIQHSADFDDSRWVAFADGTSRKVSPSDFPAVWAANNAARVGLGLPPLPPP